MGPKKQAAPVGGKRKGAPPPPPSAPSDDDDEEDDQEASSSGSDSDSDNDVPKVTPIPIVIQEEEKDEDEEKMAGARRRRAAAKQQKGKGKKVAAAEVKEEEEAKTRIKPARLSAATLKTKMSPAMLQNPIARKKIWCNLMKMMVRRGYEWVQDKPAPSDTEQLWPNNKNYLGIFHMHAVDKTAAKREPVYVIFCSKAGEPTLKSLQYPSKHIVLISDSLTGRARAALQALPMKAANAATETVPIVAVSTAAGASTLVAPTMYALKDVLVEAFVSSYFMFDLLKQRYLRVVEFSATTPKELDTVFDVFERKRDLGHFPRMLDTDPVVRHLRLPIGSVIKQTRLSTASATHNSYRVIVRTSALDIK